MESLPVDPLEGTSIVEFAWDHDVADHIFLSDALITPEGGAGRG